MFDLSVAPRWRCVVSTVNSALGGCVCIQGAGEAWRGGGGGEVTPLLRVDREEIEDMEEVGVRRVLGWDGRK